MDSETDEDDSLRQPRATSLSTTLDASLHSRMAGLQCTSFAMTPVAAKAKKQEDADYMSEVIKDEDSESEVNKDEDSESEEMDVDYVPRKPIDDSDVDSFNISDSEADSLCEDDGFKNSILNASASINAILQNSNRSSLSKPKFDAMKIGLENESSEDNDANEKIKLKRAAKRVPAKKKLATMRKSSKLNADEIKEGSENSSDDEMKPISNNARASAISLSNVKDDSSYNDKETHAIRPSSTVVNVPKMEVKGDSDDDKTLVLNGIRDSTLATGNTPKTENKDEFSINLDDSDDDDFNKSFAFHLGIPSKKVPELPFPPPLTPVVTAKPSRGRGRGRGRPRKNQPPTTVVIQPEEKPSRATSLLQYVQKIDRETQNGESDQSKLQNTIKLLSAKTTKVKEEKQKLNIVANRKKEPLVPTTNGKRKTTKNSIDDAIDATIIGRVAPKVNQKRKINNVTSNDSENEEYLNSNVVVTNPFETTTDTNTTNTVTSSATRPAEDGIGEFSGPMLVRKMLRGYFALSKNSVNAEKSERMRVERLAEKDKIIRTQLSNELPDFDKRIILDFDRETKEILAEVDPAFAAILKKHQADGVKFMFDCTVESIRRFEDEDEEEKTIDNGGSFGGILAHCMGLGKTLQVVAFVNTILNNPITSERIKRVLIIVPLNVMKNWENEFDLWFHRCNRRRKFQLFELYSIKGGKKRAEMLLKWRKMGGVMLLTAGLFTELFVGEKPFAETFEKCLLNPGPELVVIDEGHMLKNDETRLNIIASRIKTLRRIILTGTPLQNNLLEYFCMVSFVKPYLLGTKDEFSNRFANPITEGQYIDSTDYEVYIMKRRFFVLHKRLESCIHRRDYNILVPYLKPKCEFVLNIRLSEEQQNLYKYYLDTYVFGGSLGKNSARRQLFLHFYLLGFIWNHPALLVLYFKKCEKRLKEQRDIWRSDDEDTDEDDEFGNPQGRRKRRQPQLQCVSQILGSWPHMFIPKEEDPALFNPELGPKFKMLFDILKECEQIGDKLLIFSQSLDVLSLIEKMLKTQTKKNSQNVTVNTWIRDRDYFRIDGSVSSSDRQKIIEQINDEGNDDARLLLISTRAGGIGINLVGANRAIIFDTCWNPAHDVQAIYRIFRYGQKKPIFVYRLAAAGTMEEKIYKRQITKQSIALRVLDEHQIERYYTKTDLHELYDLEVENSKEVPPIPTKDFMLAKLFPSNRKHISSYHEHDSLLENKPEEDLSNEDREKAWQDFLKEQKEQCVNDTDSTGDVGNVPSTSASLPNQQTIIEMMNRTFANASHAGGKSSDDSNSDSENSEEKDFDADEWHKELSKYDPEHIQSHSKPAAKPVDSPPNFQLQAFRFKPESFDSIVEINDDSIELSKNESNLPSISDSKPSTLANSASNFQSQAFRFKPETIDSSSNSIAELNDSKLLENQKKTVPLATVNVRGRGRGARGRGRGRGATTATRGRGSLRGRGGRNVPIVVSSSDIIDLESDEEIVQPISPPVQIVSIAPAMNPRPHPVKESVASPAVISSSSTVASPIITAPMQASSILNSSSPACQPKLIVKQAPSNGAQTVLPPESLALINAVLANTAYLHSLQGRKQVGIVEVAQVVDHYIQEQENGLAGKKQAFLNVTNNDEQMVFINDISSLVNKLEELKSLRTTLSNIIQSTAAKVKPPVNVAQPLPSASLPTPAGPPAAGTQLASINNINQIRSNLHHVMQPPMTIVGLPVGLNSTSTRLPGVAQSNYSVPLVTVPPGMLPIMNSSEGMIYQNQNIPPFAKGMEVQTSAGPNMTLNHN